MSLVLDAGALVAARSVDGTIVTSDPDDLARLDANARLISC